MGRSTNENSQIEYSSADDSCTISVIVPTYQRPEDLIRCLSALNLLDPPPEEVIVVHRSTDTSSRDIVTRWIDETDERYHRKSVTVHESGMIAALNAGICRARGSIIATLDDDCEVYSSWISKLYNWFSSDSRIGGVGGRDIIMNERYTHDKDLYSPASIVGKVTWFGRCIGNHHLGCAQPMEVDILKGCNMAYRRRFAWFDTNLRGIGAQVHNEIVLGLHVRDSGYRLVYDPSLRVKHYVAKRWDDDGRESRSPRAIENEAFNQLYAVFGRKKRIPAWIGATYSFLVGHRQTPGLVRLAKSIAGHESKVIHSFGPALKGKFKAFFFILGNRDSVSKNRQSPHLMRHD